MERGEIISEIRRTAILNGGKALGVDRFENETGIRQADWSGKYWARWGDALKEAGYAPNKLMEAFDEDALLAQLAETIRELGRFPTRRELMLKKRADPAFPYHQVFSRRFASSDGMASAVIKRFSDVPEMADVVEVCRQRQETKKRPSSPERALPTPELGEVYLFKSGRYYKIGRSNSSGRRERELAIQMPEKGAVVHSIRTDDPVGIERYWHRRFEEQDKRQNGEWFDLDAADVAAFKRRKFQ